LDFDEALDDAMSTNDSAIQMQRRKWVSTLENCVLRLKQRERDGSRRRDAAKARISSGELCEWARKCVSVGNGSLAKLTMSPMF
jgi:hypothetical protein